MSPNETAFDGECAMTATEANIRQAMTQQPQWGAEKSTRDWLLDRLIESERLVAKLCGNVSKLHEELHVERQKNYSLDKALNEVRECYVNLREHQDSEKEHIDTLRERISELSVGKHIEVVRRCKFTEEVQKLEILAWGTAGGKTTIHVRV